MISYNHWNTLCCIYISTFLTKKKNVVRAKRNHLTVTRDAPHIHGVSKNSKVDIFLWIMNGSFSRVHKSLYVYCIYIYKVSDFKCDLSVLNTKERFYDPIVNIIHYGFSYLSSLHWFSVLSVRRSVTFECVHPYF